MTSSGLESCILHSSCGLRRDVEANSTARAKVSLLRRLGVLPIRVYQCTLAYVLGGHCRFTPSCSQYALEAVERHGVLKGWWLAMRRLCRCHPLCPGGHDPVPPVEEKR